MGGKGAGFSAVDWTVLVGYLVGITLFGLWMARRIRSSGSYFLGDRQLPWWVMIAQSFGTGTHADDPVAQAGATFDGGFATIWYKWKNMLITPFYWLMAPWYRRSERTTSGEIIEDRYGRGLALFYTLYALAFFVCCQGALLRGAAKVISAASGDAITPEKLIIAMSLAFILYSGIGGLIATAYTDIILGFLIIALSFMLIPAGLVVTGGFTGMREALADRPEFFDLYNDGSGMDVFTIAMLAINGIVGITAMPHTLTMNASGRTERSGRIGQTYGNMVKRFCTIGWALTGLIVAAMVVQGGVTPKAGNEFAFGYACRELLQPEVTGVPGLTGLMVACVLAATMSACSNFVVNTGALATRNIYRDYINPQAADRTLLMMGRVSGLALTALGIVFALYVEQVLDAFMFTETIAALVGIMFLGGILWKRANRQGALAATAVAFVVYYALNYLASCRLDSGPSQALSPRFSALMDHWQAGTTWDYLASGQWKLVYKWTPGPFGWAMLAGLVAFIVVSLLTRPEPRERIERFFDNMRRTSDDDTRPSGQPKPLASERGQDLLFLDLPGWLAAARWRGFFRRYREDLVGFVLAWGSVAALVLLAWGLMQIGK
jgi:Na+/proline symporter